MRRALEDAGIEHHDVDVIVANGSGIPQGDIQESLAIHSFYRGYFGKQSVTALKPVTGNLNYASGGAEAVIAALIADKQIIPPVANLEKPYAECPLPLVKNKARSSEVNIVMLNNFGFGGQNASLVFKHVKS